MLFWLFLILSVLLVVAIVVLDGACYYDSLWIASFVLGVIVWAATAIMLIVVIGNHCGVAGDVASKTQEYESLVFQVENKLYENKYDYDAWRKELIEEVRDWNKTIARGKAMEKDFWLGIFYADIYGQFQLISLDPLLEGTLQ